MIAPIPISATPMMTAMPRRRPLLLAAWFLVGLAAATPASACPFCNAVSQTLRQEMETMDAVVIATALHGDTTRNPDTGEVAMKIEKVLKGESFVDVGERVRAVYYGEVEAGRRFLLSGVEPTNLQWSCLPLTERGEAYVVKIPELPADPADRLRFYYDYLQDDEPMLARDAYDEFAISAYDDVKAIRDTIERPQLIEWIQDPDMSTDRKRLYLTLLGVVGDRGDLTMLESMLRSTTKSSRSGLDALIGCYLTLAGEEGLPLVDELFLANHQSPYADTYAAIMALRFHGTEGDVIPRSALVESLHHVLEREDLADLVIPDLARWNDWSQIERLTKMFLESDEDNNWVRVPVVNYLRACPLPAAKEAIEKLEQIDPESVKRANTYFAIPVPAREADQDQSSIQSPSAFKFAGLAAPLGVASRTSAAAKRRPMNRSRLIGVLSMAVATVMIVQYLLVTGGQRAPQPVS